MVLGFAMFAIDETDKGSKHQQAKLERELGTTVAPDAAARRPRASATTAPVREAIDDANDVLLAPVRRAGRLRQRLGQPRHPGAARAADLRLRARLLANMLPKQRQHGGDWRTAG